MNDYALLLCDSMHQFAKALCRLISQTSGETIQDLLKATSSLCNQVIKYFVYQSKNN